MKPRVHQNGFIQLDISHGRRLHVWPDGDLKHQVTSSPVHDHRFDFKSTVLCGVVENVHYVFNKEPDGDYVIYQAENILVSTQVRGRLYEQARYLVYPGETYEFRAYDFHETRGHSLTATLMQKTAVYQHTPRVLCKVGEPPDNEFCREDSNPDPLLWEYVARALILAREAGKA